MNKERYDEIMGDEKLQDAIQRVAKFMWENGRISSLKRFETAEEGSEFKIETTFGPVDFIV